MKVSGYALDLTENNILKENEYTKDIKNEPNTLNSSKHAWTLAKIDGKWVPLDATWNMFNKHVPITHIYENLGDGIYRIQYISEHPVQNKIIKESIKYIKS